jgi:hypothetical protein
MKLKSTARRQHYDLICDPREVLSLFMKYNSEVTCIREKKIKVMIMLVSTYLKPDVSDEDN